MKKIVRDMSTTESRAFWETAERTSEKIQEWPDWKRAGINVSHVRQEPRDVSVEGKPVAADDEQLLASLDPGIRETVHRLREWGFSPTDSGDGVPTPHVHIVSNAPMRDAHLLRSKLLQCGVVVSPVGRGQVWIQATYDPSDCTGVISLYGLDDAGWLPSNSNWYSWECLTCSSTCPIVEIRLDGVVQPETLTPKCPTCSGIMHYNGRYWADADGYRVNGTR